MNCWQSVLLVLNHFLTARGPASLSDVAASGKGPAAAITIPGKPFSLKEVEAMADALGVPATPDPALPSAWSRLLTDSGSSSGSASGFSAAESILDTALSAFALAFLAWLVVLFAQRDRA